MPHSRMMLIALAAAAASGAGCSYTGSVMGTVAQGGTQAVVRDARVVLTEKEGKKRRFVVDTQYGGTFSTTLREGVYEVTAEHPSLEPCTPAADPVRISRDKIARTQVCMQPVKALANKVEGAVPATPGSPADAAATGSPAASNPVAGDAANPSAASATPAATAGTVVTPATIESPAPTVTSAPVAAPTVGTPVDTSVADSRSSSQDSGQAISQPAANQSSSPANDAPKAYPPYAAPTFPTIPPPR